MDKRVRNLTGLRFGMLVAVELIGKRNHSALWRCRCDCGTEKDIPSAALTCGRSKSCGCSSIQMMKANLIKHGHWAGGKASSEYAAWEKARHRCHNPRSHAFKDYGARGIAMCDRWRFGEGGKTGFECFLADMGPRPVAALELDREDNFRGYEPRNCRWTTRKTNCRNKRNNRFISYGGRLLTVAEAAEISDMKYVTLIKRLDHGWPIQRAMTEPVRPHSLGSP
jgi:hypothetical protein